MQAYDRGEAEFHGRLRELSAPAAFRRWLAAATAGLGPAQGTGPIKR